MSYGEYPRYLKTSDSHTRPFYALASLVNLAGVRQERKHQTSDNIGKLSGNSTDGGHGCLIRTELKIRAPLPCPKAGLSSSGKAAPHCNEVSSGKPASIFEAVETGSLTQSTGASRSP